MGLDNERRTARVILLNAAHQVLLIRFVIERGGQQFVFWATPGGSVEKDETDLDAAHRELAEELALNIGLTGPVHTAASSFEHEGRLVDNIDVFFLGHHEQQGVSLHFKTEAERVAMKDLRWWTLAELETSSETVFPRDLARILRSLACLAP
jgi:ADP-ribose pyrophosphatase YjhB (NUDIX family)